MVHGKAPLNATTPLYKGYALDMEYLTPFLHTLKERI